jgi:O-antigen/teichoic acid export membrane protein
MLPVAISLPLVNGLIFIRLIPRHARNTAAKNPPSARQISRFLAGDYTGALCVLAVNNLVPVAVAATIGPSVNAYFYIAWMVGGTLDLLAVNMATSLTVEGAFEEAGIAANCRAALRKTLLILVPTAAAVALGAPAALRLFGPQYAAHGARILQLLAIATLPKALTEMYLGALRAQSRARAIAIIQGVRAVLILGLAFALTKAIGTVGAGIAVLISQAVVAAIIAPGLLALLRTQARPVRQGAPAMSVPTSVVRAARRKPSPS